MRTGRQLPGLFPFTIMDVKDGTIMMGCIKEDHWKLILNMMGNPEWANDPKYSNVYSRYQYRDELMPLMEPWLKSHTCAEILKLGRETGAFKVCMPLQTIDAMVNSDHTKERDFFFEIDHPEAGKINYPGPPYKLTETPWMIRRPAPLLGEHNEEIISNRLGFTKEDILSLRATDII